MQRQFQLALAFIPLLVTGGISHAQTQFTAAPPPARSVVNASVATSQTTPLPSAPAEAPNKPSTAQATPRPMATTKSDAQIRQGLIRQSIASYRGSCPCPYNTDRAGRSCGARSAYSRPEGSAPLCYERDVTQKMIDEYRSRTFKIDEPLNMVVSLLSR